jgi:hypothetical protein
VANSIGRIGISEAYDYRVALPLIVVALFGMLFVEVNGHKSINLKSASVSTSSKNLVKNAASPNVSSASNLPTLSSTVQTEDLAPGATPFDVQTTSPQSSSSSSASASVNSDTALQNPTSTSGSSGVSSSPATSQTTTSQSSSQASQNEVENLINGTTNEVINVTKGLNGTLKLL